MKQNKRARDNTRTKERRWKNLGRQWNSLCRWINLHFQQQENSGTSATKEP